MSMSIFKGLFKSRDKPQNSYDSPSYSYFSVAPTLASLSMTAPRMQHTAVYACVRVLSEAIAQLPLHVYQYTESGKERVPRHPLLLFAPRPAEPGDDQFCLSGNADEPSADLWQRLCPDSRNGRGEVMGLYPLMPDRIKVDRDERNRLVYIYSRYDEQNPNFREQGEIILPAEQVLHIVGWDMMDLLVTAPSLWRKMPLVWLWRVMSMAHLSLPTAQALRLFWNIPA